MGKMEKHGFGLGAGRCGMGRSAMKSQGNVREFYIAWRVVNRISFLQSV